MTAFRTLIAAYALAIGVLIAPPIFDRGFSMLHLLARERPWLWAASVGVVLAGLYCRFGRWRSWAVTFILFNGLVLTTVELGARFGIRQYFPQRQLELRRWGDATYEDLFAYQGHPFLQFTGKPRAALRGNRTLGNLSPFNNFGFIGGDFTYEKPPAIVRVAALGGSTTADGYPAIMESFMNHNTGDDAERYEVLNFGMGYWTSAHSLVNFVLNVVDFRPDYVIVHDGWNDAKIRSSAADFRGDYAHALKVFDPPTFVPDRYLVRTSVVYRVIKLRSGPPDWASLDRAVEWPRQKIGGFDHLHELKPFRRNVETVIQIARSRNITVVLLTVPRSRDPGKQYFYDAQHIDQVNEILRELAVKYASQILFVDLDRMMTGKMESAFRDVGHVDEEGQSFKAEQVGRTILTHRRSFRKPG
jgi:GDSL-like lipase/acylhydrolase family protein